MEKYTYIKLGKGYLDFNEKFNPELFDNLGETYEDYLQDKWVLLSEDQVRFHEEHPQASVKEVLAMELQVHVRTLEEAKQEKIWQIAAYDTSSEVDSFTINKAIVAWLDPNTRADYKQSIEAAKLLGEENVTFFINGNEFTVPTNLAEFMLAQIQLYANRSYCVTERHKLNVEALESVEDVDSYDYKTGYPEKLNFDIQ
ncbi:MAG: hypothetical protein J1F67_05205 [Muribaculaceae bacterium]|nr:hypothetical protein [Muribaculaceae bacterium]